VAEGPETKLLDAWWQRAAENDEGVESPEEEGTRGLVSYAGLRVSLPR
jgi:hypothetical protein